MSTWPVIVVTGANAGVGFGICRRLLFQLCLSNPPDSQPQAWAQHSTDTLGSEEPLRADGLTLVMACRSTQRAETARKDLYQELDAHIAQLRARTDYDGHADVFRRNLKIEVERLDLAELNSVFAFAAQMTTRYPYISHFVFNAGVASFHHIDWVACLKQVARNLLSAITRPEFYVQSVGEVSVDGLGWIWQSNLFGHYVLFRALEPLLKNPAYPADSRIIWSSSLEASPKFYDNEDWQLIKSEHSYESVKYEVDLISTILDHRALADTSSAKRVRHFVSHPGVCSTKISTNLVAHGGILDTLKILLFHIGRLLNSRHHTIYPANAAIATTHLILVSLSFITFAAFPKKAPTNGSANGNGVASHLDPQPPVRFGAETDRWGHAEVGITPVKEWKENQLHGELLLERCDALYREFSEKRKTSGTDS
ncbi:3-keto sterol reductase [Mycena filopes]|nr:3-keto sterol reductase [Mycena filopes]